MNTRILALVAATLVLPACSEGTGPEDESCKTSTALALEPGQRQTLTNRSQLACFHLPGGVPDLTVLMMPQNASEVVGSSTPFELAGIIGAPALASVHPGFSKPSLTTTPHHDFELRIRRSERDLLKGPVPAVQPQYSRSGAVTCPTPAALGDRCEFNVFNKDEKFERVTAVVMAITARAIVYQDTSTSAVGGLTAADFNKLGTMFDDPIYTTDVALFGEPSDLDNNDKVFILLTPVVNALTPRSAGGFIAGFFYGCDLLSRSSCSGSNEAEIFYAMTTDPSAQYSDVRTRGAVMNSLPPVLAHEFQHMINFAQRNKTQDVLWLSEGMAHHAEDAVADVLEARGEAVSAAQFRVQNTTRANRYLRVTSSVSLLSDDDESSLELRGGAWLFVKYLAEQYGNEVLRKMTGSTLKSVANVTTQTGQSWSTLMSNWGVALWADNAPELAGVTLPRELTYPGINLRTRLSSGGTFPLRPPVHAFSNFTEMQTLAASSQTYVIVEADGAAPQPLNFTATGPFSGDARPQVTVLRIN